MIWKWRKYWHCYENIKLITKILPLHHKRPRDWLSVASIMVVKTECESLLNLSSNILRAVTLWFSADLFQWVYYWGGKRWETNSVAVTTFRRTFSIIWLQSECWKEVFTSLIDQRSSAIYLKFSLRMSFKKSCWARVFMKNCVSLQHQSYPTVFASK